MPFSIMFKVTLNNVVLTGVISCQRKSMMSPLVIEHEKTESYFASIKFCFYASLFQLRFIFFQVRSRFLNKTFYSSFMERLLLLLRILLGLHLINLTINVLKKFFLGHNLIKFLLLQRGLLWLKQPSSKLPAK